VDLAQLMAVVEESGGDDPLRRIEAAALLRREIEQVSDELLDHFVNEARSAGCTWTQIGDALGVTRQAAQQRHAGLADRLLQGSTDGTFNRFTRRARAAMVAAHTAARDRRNATVDTEHVLLGLFANVDGNVATAALGALGVDRAAIERLVDGRSPIGAGPVPAHPPFSPLAKKSLELALREAMRLGHNYIGCEHIVLALSRVGRDGVAGQILLDQGVTYERLETAIREELRGIA
jgi:Clp amino terminal domain, pathogenicity island component